MGAHDARSLLYQALNSTDGREITAVYNSVGEKESTRVSLWGMLKKAIRNPDIAHEARLIDFRSDRIGKKFAIVIKKLAGPEYVKGMYSTDKEGKMTPIRVCD